VKCPRSGVPNLLVAGDKGHSRLRLIDAAKRFVEAYQVHTPSEILVELDLVESDARVLHHFISNEEVLQTMNSWILDPSIMRARNSQYLNIIDIY
jgi:hypothetical protein